MFLHIDKEGQALHSQKTQVNISGEALPFRNIVETNP